MKLSTVLEQSRTGDISGISNVPKDDSTIISYINLGLIALYSRFQLKTEEAIIALQNNKTIYALDGTDSDVTVNGVLIEEDNVISITEAFDEFGPISINNDTDPASVFTVAYNRVQVPVSETGMYVSLVYKAAPTLITFVDDGNGNAVDTNIPLPLTLLEPLLMFIGYRSYLAFGGAGTPEGDKYELKFDNACLKAEILGLVPSEEYGIDIKDRGFL